MTFEGMEAGPSGAKASGHISADGGGNPLHDHQPDRRHHGEGSRRYSESGPRRYRRQAEARAKGEKEKGEGGNQEGTPENGSPGSARDIGKQTGMDGRFHGDRSHRRLPQCQRRARMMMIGMGMPNSQSKM